MSASVKLSQNTVPAITQDSLGFLWFGTQDGLNRYDGYSIVTFKNDPRDSTSLGGNRIKALSVDHLGMLWIGTAGEGLQQYQAASEGFRRIKSRGSKGHGFDGAEITSILSDSNGDLWVGTSVGLFIRRGTDAASQRVELPSRLSNNRFNWVHDLALLENQIFLATAAGVFTHDPEEGSTKEVWTAGSSASALELEISAGNHLWIATRGAGLLRHNLATGEQRQYLSNPNQPNSISDNWITALLEDRDQNLWIGTRDGGLCRYRPDTDDFEVYQHDSSLKNSLAINEIRSLFQDRSGVIWVGCAGALQYIIPQTRGFRHYKNLPGNQNSLSNNSVWAFEEDHDGKIWIGTLNGGLNRFDPVSGSFTRYRKQAGNARSLSHNAVWSIHADRDGSIWVGTRNGLNKLDRARRRFSQYRADKKNWFPALLQDHRGTLWVGSWGEGLSTIAPGDRQLRPMILAADSDSLPNQGIWTLYPDFSGKIWVGTESGLARLDPVRQKITSFVHEFPDHAADHWIIAIHQSADSTLWLGTDRGLVRLPANGQRASLITERDGLPNNTIYGILEDDNGRLWLSSNKGICRYHPETGEVRAFTSDDGLQADEFNGGAALRTRGGEMYFGGVNGFNVFHPDSIRSNQYVPPVVITNFSRYDVAIEGGASVIEAGMPVRKSVELHHTDKILTFDFAALNFINSDQNRYAYKLHGFTDNWIDLGTQRRVTFTNLDPGQYTLQVRGANNDGIWNDAGTNLQITVHPPWWQRPWAYALYVLALVGLILAYIRYKTAAQARQLEIEREKLEQEKSVSERLRQIDKLKDDFLANTSHELKTPLNGIIGLAEGMRDQDANGDPDKTRRNLDLIVASGRRLSSLVNDILDFSRLKRHDLILQSKPLHVRVVADLVLRFSEPLVSGKNIKLVNKVTPDTPPVHADENRLLQILQNLIDNAIKFTQKGKVTIEARHEGDEVLVSVTDTGIGIPAEKHADIFNSFEQVDGSVAREYGGAGIGLSVTRKLVELHGGNISVESEPGKGACFSFSLPVSTEKPETGSNPEPASEVARPREFQKQETVAMHQNGNGSYKILVVDDEAINQQVLANQLESTRFSLVQAFSGEEALNIIKSGEQFDLVLLDIMMPRMSGFEVCQKIRETHLATELPVIMVTAKNQVADLVEGLSVGANDYVSKPFSKNELLARIKTHLNLLNINSAYGRFLPHEFLRFLGRETILDVSLGDHVQKELSIFVSDIREFTQLSETMSPEDNFKFINGYLGQASPLIRNHNGFIDRYTGDAIMALFPDSPADAIRAAIGTQQLVEDMNKYRIEKGRMPFKVGIGLHVGRLMLGIVGEQERLQGDIFSDAVNLASRIEGLSKRYGAPVLVSEQLLQELPPDHGFNTRFLGKVRVKGKQQAVSVIEVLDGDVGEQLALKLESSKRFEQALDRYMARDFTNASVAFKEVLDANPEDKAARLYLQRAAEYIVAGVPENWKGIEEMDAK